MKRSFLLLEVLIALILVSLFAVPLILGPIRSFRQEMQGFEALEAERLADWTFAEIKEQLHRNQIPWSQIPSFKQTKGPFPLKPEKVLIPGRADKLVERQFSLYGKGEKKNLDGDILRMIYVKIEFSPSLGKKKKNYTYRAIVKATA